MAGRIGPHEGREIALLQSGEKRIAWFSEIDFAAEDEAAPLVQSGVLKREIWASETSGLTGVVYYLPGAETELAELKTLIVHWLDSGIDADTADMRVGQILGYTPDDIAAFLENRARISNDPQIMRLSSIIDAKKRR